MKRALQSVTLVTLLLLTTACPVTLSRGQDATQKAVNEAIFQLQRADFGINETSKQIEVFGCVKCETHFISKDFALLWTDRLILANEYIGKIAAIFRSAKGQTQGTITLTGDHRARLDVALNALAAVLVTNDGGLSSNISITLANLLNPVLADIASIRDKLKIIKTNIGDATFDASLTVEQWKRVDELMAERK